MKTPSGGGLGGGLLPGGGGGELPLLPEGGGIGGVAGLDVDGGSLGGAASKGRAPRGLRAALHRQPSMSWHASSRQPEQS